jgi:hypothetical protein
MIIDTAQLFCIAEQLQPGPEHRVVTRLTGVTGNCPLLRDPVDGQPEVELRWRATTERGAELEVERYGDVLRQPSRDNGQMR